MNSTPILIQSDIVTLRAVSNGNYIFSSAATSLGPNLTRSTRTRRTASEKTPLKQNPAEVIAFGSVMMFGRGRGRRQSSFAALFIWFSDDRRFFVPVLVFLVFFILVIIVVGVSRRPRIVSDGDEARVDQPGENFLGDAWGHVAPVWMLRRSPPTQRDSGIDSHVDVVTTLERGGLEFEV